MKSKHQYLLSICVQLLQSKTKSNHYSSKETWPFYKYTSNIFLCRKFLFMMLNSFDGEPIRLMLYTNPDVILCCIMIMKDEEAIILNEYLLWFLSIFFRLTMVYLLSTLNVLYNIPPILIYIYISMYVKLETFVNCFFKVVPNIYRELEFSRFRIHNRVKRITYKYKRQSCKGNHESRRHYPPP